MEFMKPFFIIILILLSSCSKEKIILSLNKETIHFKFYCTSQDINILDDLINRLENNYVKITSDFNVNLKDKISVFIYPDIKTYHKEIGKPKASNSLVGSVIGTAIKMVSPNNSGGVHDYELMMKIIVHEFTHSIINYVSGSVNKNNYHIPTWLNEGLAFYEAQQMNEEWKKPLKKMISKNKVPSIKDLNSNHFSGSDYIFSFTIAEFMIGKYGFKKIIEIIKNPQDIEKILGIDMDYFEKQWLVYLKKKYLDDINL